MSKQKSALGKGLGALLPDHGESQDDAPEIARTKLYNFQDRLHAAGRIAEIGVHLIDPNPYQPRTRFEEGAMGELVQSIRQLGIIQPITVRAAKGGRYEIISGERRWRASREADLTTIPAFIRQADTEAMLEMAIVENVQRSALNPIEVALGYRRLMDECKLTQEEVSTKVGKSRAAVTNTLRLLRLSPEVQAALKKGSLTAGHARPLLSLENPGQQVVLLARIEREELSVRAVEDAVKDLLNRSTVEKNTRKAAADPSPERTAESPEERAIRDRLRTHFGTQVNIKPSRGGEGGTISLEYYSEEDLERIIELLLD